MSTALSRAERIRRLVEEYGLDEGEATFAVDLADGKHKGDIVGLSDAERERLGLGRSLLDLEPAASPRTRAEREIDKSGGKNAAAASASRFRTLLDALGHGALPHGGIAVGIARGKTAVQV